MSRPVFKAFTNAQNFNASRGHLLDAGHAFTAAQDAIDTADCEIALNDMRKGAFHLGNANKHGDFSSREGGEDLDHAGLNDQSKRAYDHQRETQEMFAAKCLRGAEKPAKKSGVPEELKRRLEVWSIAAAEHSLGKAENFMYKAQEPARPGQSSWTPEETRRLYCSMARSDIEGSYAREGAAETIIQSQYDWKKGHPPNAVDPAYTKRLNRLAIRRGEVEDEFNRVCVIDRGGK